MPAHLALRTRARRRADCECEVRAHPAPPAGSYPDKTPAAPKGHRAGAVRSFGAFTTATQVEYVRTHSRCRRQVSLLPPEVSRLLDATDPAAREAAWQAFLEAYSRLLLHAARGVSRDYDAAMDSYAYVLEQLRSDECRRLRGYVSDQRSKFTTWLVVVARRLCLDRLRERYGRASGAGARGREARLARRQLVDLLTEELDAHAPLSPRASDDPERRLRVEELHRALSGALASLDPRDQLLLKLRFEDDRTARQIARIMRFRTPFHVYRRLGALLVLLRKALSHKGIESAEP